MSAQTEQWCVERHHPFVTYNPWLDRSYCRCGTRQEAGESPMDWQAKWDVFHDHEADEPCRCYARKQAQSKQRSADGQGDLFEAAS